MSKVDEAINRMSARIEAKYWDFPKVPDEMRIVSYDANSNPLIIEYYRQNQLLFTHTITYDVDGNLLTKKIIVA